MDLKEKQKLMVIDIKEKQIIYMDDKPHIKCNMVMLSTKNESSLWINCENKLKIHIKDRMCPGKQEFQYLYITLDEKLSKDEWYCSPMGIVSRYNGIEKLPSNWRKIIATTDESLGLPQLSQQFIEKYIEEYNKGNQITEVLVEVEDYWVNVAYSMDVAYRLKVDSQNQITIRKHKDSWSREEVIDLISDWTKMKSGLNMNLPNNFNQWIEENL